MFGNGRKTIGVFICRAVNHFHRNLCRGIERRGRELGYNVAFFSCIGDFVGNEKTANGESAITQIPEYEKLDGVILVPDSFDIPRLSDEIYKNIRSRCDCPIISIRIASNEFIDFLIDNHYSMEHMICHFIEHHGFKDICFVAGPKDHEDSMARLSCFKDVMKAHGLEVKEDQIFYGTFWRQCAKPACDKLIDERGHIPEAIICANDYMGIAISHELINRGIRIPEDVSICGYDGIWETRVCSPALSTVVVPFERMGKEAVEVIAKADHGLEVPKTVMFSTEDIYSESCGCMELDQREILSGRKEFYENAEHEIYTNTLTTFGSVELEEITNEQQIWDVIFHYLYDLATVHGCYICLFEDVLSQHQGYQYDEEFPRKVTLNFGYKNWERVVKEPINFDCGCLLPHKVMGPEPQNYYFLPLHYKEDVYGYCAVMASGQGGYDDTIQTCMVALGNAFHDLFSRHKMQSLIWKLEDLHTKDPLTGIRNRGGFLTKGNELFHKAVNEERRFGVIEIDMNGLKVINDTYGHRSGDEAIRLIAQALVDGEIGNECVKARVGGDEFVVAAICEKELFKEYMIEIQEILKQLSSIKKFPITISVGGICKVPEGNEKIEDYMRIADQRMYEIKRKVHQENSQK